MNKRYLEWVYKFSKLIQSKIYEFSADCVASTGVVISSVFFAGYHDIWMKQLSVRATTNFI